MPFSIQERLIMERECPFCFPAAETVTYEDAIIRIIRDVFPVSPGHMLVTPRRHVGDWFAASAIEQQALIAAIARARDLILENNNPDGFNIGINVGKAAGQTIPHLHVHLIPRYLGDVTDPTGGVRGVIPTKANYLAQEVTMDVRAARGTLVRGGASDPLLVHLLDDLDLADRLDLAVAFILPSGVDLLENHIRDLIDRGGVARILTGDYQRVTDPQALRRLKDIGDRVDLRVYECQDRSFHPKAYLISAQGGTHSAYVGSSNLTRTALCDGVEWNYRIEKGSDPQGFAAVVDAFEQAWIDPNVRPVTDEWLDGYSNVRPHIVSRALDVAVEPAAEVPEPHEIQVEALAALESTRAEGNKAGLVVLATGLGKTWLSAFDSSRPDFKRVLFVAHREEILSQSLKTFRKIRPDARLGLYTGGTKDRHADVLFASVQTLSRLPHLRQFDPAAFDYIVVDEFHHAAAATYRKIINYFTPKFMLGLTATPERTDGGDLLGLCEENLVYRCGINRGITLGLLAPFHYFGVPDKVDYSNIPWRSSRFDETELTAALATEARAQNALEQLKNRGGEKALGFCCSVRHADYMASFFNERGVRSVAVHSGPTSAPRSHSLEKLSDGELDIVFAVDLFNEGVDLPDIDTVMMLRPTESRIVWQQQLGRGLRVAEGKDKLRVIDYIGNHRGFLLKPQTLFDLGDAKSEIRDMLRQWKAGALELPAGCDVTYDLETVEILSALVQGRPGANVVQEFYQDFLAMHGHRPTAMEAHHAGINPNAVRQEYGSWLGFVRSQKGLSLTQERAYGQHKTFLDQLAITHMTKSFKMVLLLAMLNEDALPGAISIGNLVQAFRSRATRSQRLKVDVGPDIEHDDRLRRHLERNPIAAWTSGQNAGRQVWFFYDGEQFGATFDVEPDVRVGFQELAREMCEWRLGQYLDRSSVVDESADQGIVLKVNSSHGRPVIFPIEREKISGVPYGTTAIRANDEDFEADFVKVAVNVMRRPGTQENVLASVLRGWFGPDAGLPGTNHHVTLEQHEGYWVLEPQRRGVVPVSAKLWTPYPRASIPGLFGEPYVENKWRQGFIREGRHLFLLVTLEKAGMATEHQYADRFLSPTLFEWQSQNRQARHLPSGRVLRDHENEGLTPVLFVRPRAKNGSQTAPFYYCGELIFESWAGDMPITVQWRLKEQVPDDLYGRFGGS